MPLVRDGRHRRGHDAHVRRGDRWWGGDARHLRGRTELVSLRARPSDPRVVPRRRSRRARGRLRRRAPRGRSSRGHRASIAEPSGRQGRRGRRRRGGRRERVLGTDAESRRSRDDWKRVRTKKRRAAVVGLRRADDLFARRPSLARVFLSRLRLDEDLAIVSNGSALLGSGFGRDIDRGDAAVARFNEYETSGFEDDVGARITAHVTGWLFSARRGDPGDRLAHEEPSEASVEIRLAPNVESLARAYYVSYARAVAHHKRAWVSSRDTTDTTDTTSGEKKFSNSRMSPRRTPMTPMATRGGATGSRSAARPWRSSRRLRRTRDTGRTCDQTVLDRRLDDERGTNARDDASHQRVRVSSARARLRRDGPSRRRGRGMRLRSAGRADE